uniref:GPI mannosyltransferase 2 n=1 Tax=Plectus sambesii TaxID=2011161 RepID=A0A914WUB2_9BILA
MVKKKEMSWSDRRPLQKAASDGAADEANGTTLRWTIRMLLSSRLFVLVVQAASNLLIPDHDADAFKSVPSATRGGSAIDGLVERTLGGFARWDAVHFLHIAQYGYTYENNLAFAPLFPFLLRYTTALWMAVVPPGWLQQRSALLITAYVINVALFCAAGVLLHRLTLVMTKDKRLSAVVVALFALNPASIFFSAAYSEGLFSCLTWLGLYLLYSDSTPPKGTIEAAFCFALALLTRSNGLLNCGFIACALIAQLFRAITTTRTNLKRFAVLSEFVRVSAFAFLTAFVVLLPCFYYMHSMYKEFCVRSSASMTREVQLLAEVQNYVMPGQLDRLSWCNSALPNFYSAVQSKYWNVRLFGYWMLRKVPCFLLASPVLVIASLASVKTITSWLSKYPSISLFLSDRRSTFPLVVHIVFMATFSLFFINVEVVTRLLFSSSPLLYWYIASILCDRLTMEQFSAESLQEYSLFRIYRLFWSARGAVPKLIVLYFLGYTVLGTCLHANFLPWT